MKVLVYSDIHSKELPLLDRSDIDCVFLLGDIDWRDIKRIDNHYDCPKFGVLGNHDKLDYFVNTSVIPVHEKVVEFNGFKISGFQGSPIYNHKTRVPQYDEAEAAHFAAKVGEVDIFLAHSNPAYRRDPDKTNGHRGFEAFKYLMDKKRIKYLFHGHVHKNEIYKYENTTVVVTHLLREIELQNA